MASPAEPCAGAAPDQDVIGIEYADLFPRWTQPMMEFRSPPWMGDIWADLDAMDDIPAILRQIPHRTSMHGLTEHFVWDTCSRDPKAESKRERKHMIAEAQRAERHVRKTERQAGPHEKRGGNKAWRYGKR